MIGFTTYLMLVSQIGSPQAGYVTEVFSVVALIIYTFLEGYEWTAKAVMGVPLTPFGIAVIFRRFGQKHAGNIHKLT